MISDNRLCEMCEESYGRNAHITGLGINLEVIDEDDFRVYVFRGSMSRADWYRDLTVVPQFHGQLGTVHAGFLRSVESIWADTPAEGNIIITGHSLGGAQALLLGALFVAGGRPPKKITTFGSPSVGFKFANKLATLLLSIPGFDYRNADDPVPTILSLYEHPRPLFQLGKVWDDLHVIEDHNIRKYRESLLLWI